jgi:hypothetical protein
MPEDEVGAEGVRDEVTLVLVVVALGVAGLPRTAAGCVRAREAGVGGTRAGAGVSLVGSAVGSTAAGVGSDAAFGWGVAFVDGSAANARGGIVPLIGGMDTGGVAGSGFVAADSSVGVASSTSELRDGGVLLTSEVNGRGRTLLGDDGSEPGPWLCRRGWALSDSRRLWFSNLARRLDTDPAGRSSGRGICASQQQKC